MYDWAEVEAARLRRRELLQEAEKTRIARETRRHHGQRVSLPSVIRREPARGFGRAGELLRRLSPHT